jgi:hypothetical protein
VVPVQLHVSRGHQTRLRSWRQAGSLHRPAAHAPDVCAPVCRSVFYLPKPRPLSHLVADLWRGPTLVLQGALDPLNDAKGSASSSLLSSEATFRLRLHMPVVPQSMDTPTVSCYVKSDNIALYTIEWKLWTCRQGGGLAEMLFERGCEAPECGALPTRRSARSCE